jgi:steroid delta-isomerase-like uncharacterized protein
MSREEVNKNLIRRYVKDQDAGESNFVRKYIAEDVIVHYPGGTVLRGMDQMEVMATSFQTAFPDAVHNIEDMVAEGDRVSVRYTLTGTNMREYLGKPATGKELKLTLMEINRITGDKIKEAWLEFDATAFNEVFIPAE